jgi:TRAP-type C4-dicarboxylate transport system permease small subunit
VVAIGAVMIILVFVNVLLHIVGRDLAAVTEMLAELLMVWVTFLSGGSASRRGAQMSITEFDRQARRTRTGPLPICRSSTWSRCSWLVLLIWYGAITW